MKLIRSIGNKKHINYLLSLVSVNSINNYLFGFEKVDYKNGFIAIFLFAVITFLTNNRPKTEKNSQEEQIQKVACISAIFLAFAMMLGNCLYRTNSLSQLINSPISIVKTLLFVLGMAWLFFLLLERLLSWFHKYDWSIPTRNEWKWFGGNIPSLFLCWGIIFLCWIPCLLAYFPGIFTYDAPAQMLQAEGQWELNDFWTILHTLFLKFCFILGGSHQNGVLVHSILQMVLMSLCFSFTLFYLARLGMHYKIRILAFAWFALSPFNAIFSVITAKDVLFGGILILLTVLMMDLVDNPIKFFTSISKQIGVVMLCLLFSLLRNNAFHALVITTVLMFIIYRKYWKGVLRTFGVGMLVSYLIIGPLFSALDLKYKSPEEMLSIPAQQIALVSKNHWEEFTDEQRETVLELFDVNPGEVYSPRNADATKGRLKGVDLQKLFHIWRQFLMEYPREYVEAFLTLNLPYWHPDIAYPENDSNQKYIADQIYTWAGHQIERRSLSQPLLTFYEQFAQNKVAWMDFPFISAICSIGMPIWILGIVFLLLLAKKKGSMAVVLLPSAAYWLTLMAGPLSIVRYVYPFIAAYPVYIALVAFISQKRKQ